jgi:hypothetical protein
MSLPRINVQQLLVFAMVLFFFVASAQPLIDTDLWWHLANGRYILAHGVPGTDVYSYTAVGHVWVVHEWLADVIFYGVYRSLGLRGLIVLSGFAIATGGWLVYHLLRRGGLGAVSAVVVAVLLGLASSPSWGARPQVLNFLLTAAVCALLLAYRERPGRRLFLLVPPFLLWANLHSGYLVGVALVALFFTGEAMQTGWTVLAAGRGETPVLTGRNLSRVAAVAVLGLLAGLLTPATWRTVLFPFGTLSSGRIQSLIVEWSSPDFHSLAGRALLLVLLVLGGGLLASARARRGADPTLLLWGLGSLALALTSQRNVPIFAAAGAPLVGVAASALLAGLGLKPRLARPAAGVAVALNLVLAVVLGVGAVYFVGLRNTDAAIDKAVVAVEPVGATDYILSHRPQGRVFNGYAFGGWLIWRAYPQYRVFIDGRIEVYGDQVFDQYIRTMFLSDQWQTTLDQYQVQTVIIPAGEPIRLVLEQSGWTLAYQDSTARVYTRPHA